MGTKLGYQCVRIKWVLVVVLVALMTGYFLWVGSIGPVLPFRKIIGLTSINISKCSVSSSVWWDGERPITPQPPWQEECLFSRIRPDRVTNIFNDSFSMCLRKGPDHLSDHIRKHGKWTDCNGLYDSWKKLENGNESEVFVDVGANIGACLFSILASHQTVITYAFEPMAYNNYYLTRTILGLSRERADNWRQRLNLGMVAVGRNDSDHWAYLEPGNAGNTVLDTATSASKKNPILVRTRRLDDLLPPDVNIRLMKIDIQGYEMEAFAGASRLFERKAIRSIHIDISTNFLMDHGTSPSELCNFLRKNGFVLYYKNQPLSDTMISGWDKTYTTNVGIVALLN